MNVTRPIAVFGGVPLLALATAYFYMQRCCFTWRAELCDEDMTAYGKALPDDMIYIRRPSANRTTALDALPTVENPGLMVREGFLNEDEHEMLLEDCLHHCRRFGLPHTTESQNSMRALVEAAGLDASFVGTNRIVSDRYEDPRPPLAPWGCGDALQLERLPLCLRVLSARIQARMPTVGKLRHVYLEYSPTGEWFRKPRVPIGFDGHEYVLVPLFGRRGAVVTFSASQRDHTLDGMRRRMEGWTALDLDVYVPPGACLQVYGQGRFKWGWGLRPGTSFFGHESNPLPLGSNFLSLEDGETSSRTQSSAAGWMRRLFGRNAQPLVPQEPQAMLVMTYEGPVKEGKQRRRLTRWEYFAYGVAPDEKTFDWDSFNAPSREQIDQGEGGAIMWFFKNLYLFSGAI